MTRRIFGLLGVGVFILSLSGCGSEETVQGRLSFLVGQGEEGEEDEEVTQEGVTIKIFDQEGVIDLRHRAEVELGKLLIDLRGSESGVDFLETYLSTLFAIVDSTPASEEVETDQEGRFEFSLLENECLVTAKLALEDENLRWIRVIRRHALNPEGVDLRTENQIKFGGAEQFLSIAEIENKRKMRMEELELRSKWKPEIAKQNISETKKPWQPTLGYIPPGTFLMGSNSNESFRAEDERLHEVTISHGFWIGMYEVTNREWNAVWGITEFDVSKADFPVTKVPYGKAQAFCWRLTELVHIELPGQFPLDLIFRLPTEAEWEYACRAGEEQKATIFGDQLSTTEANYGDPEGNTTKAGSYKEKLMTLKPLPRWILYDMHGNVLEWCFDWYGDYPVSPAVDPMGALRGKARVLRGGSFKNSGSRCRSASRHRLSPISRSDNVGFRLVLGYPL